MVWQKILFGIVVLVAVVGGFYIFGSFSQNPINTAGVITNFEDENQEAVTGNVIEMTSSGFNPGTLTISVGETVTFVNKGDAKHWPASDIHPTHTVYPESDIKKCFDENTDKSILFDSCRGLSPGESWSFTFNEAGEWDYHDHLRANLRGTIIVE